MSLLDSELIPDLFLPENINPSFIPSQFSDSMNDFLSDLSQTPPKKKDIKCPIYILPNRTTRLL